MRFIITLILIVSTASCIAQTNKRSLVTNAPDCTAITTSPQVDACAHIEKVQSNALLLKTFSNLEKRIRDMYAPKPKLGTELIEKVRKAQKAWLTFRRLNCSVEAFLIEKGTPAYATAINDCIIRMNAARIKALNKLPN